MDQIIFLPLLVWFFKNFSRVLYNIIVLHNKRNSEVVNSNHSSSVKLKSSKNKMVVGYIENEASTSISTIQQKKNP